MGACVGDAAGAYIEFNHYINKELVQEALQFQAGGTFNLEGG